MVHSYNFSLCFIYLFFCFVPVSLYMYLHFIFTFLFSLNLSFTVVIFPWLFCLYSFFFFVASQEKLASAVWCSSIFSVFVSYFCCFSMISRFIWFIFCYHFHFPLPWFLVLIFLTFSSGFHILGYHSHRHFSFTFVLSFFVHHFSLWLEDFTIFFSPVWICHFGSRQRRLQLLSVFSLSIFRPFITHADFPLRDFTTLSPLLIWHFG